MKDLVKREYKTKWIDELYPKWFVQDPEDVDQAREPGLFKEEVNITSGGMVSLRLLSSKSPLINLFYFDEKVHNSNFKEALKHY